MGMVEARAAAAEFEALLDRVERGEAIVITRDGRPVARLVGEAADDDRRAGARAAAQALAELGRGMTLGGLSIRALIDDGRR